MRTIYGIGRSGKKLRRRALPLLESSNQLRMTAAERGGYTSLLYVARLRRRGLRRSDRARNLITHAHVPREIFSPSLEQAVGNR